MAGVPGQTREQRIRYLKADMKPGDYIMDDANGYPMIVRAAKRDVDQSVLNTVGQFADKYMGFGGDRRRSRFMAGLASQWYGLDEGGNPTMGETPGIVYETKSLGALPPMLAQFVTRKEMQWLGFPPEQADKIAQDMWHIPQWAQDASEKADRIHQAIREDMRLKAPHGFEENAQEAMGVMAGQLPIPASTATKGAKAGTSALSKLGKAAEWFTPTVEARPSNYLFGAGVGGALGALGDEDEVPVTVEDPDQPGLYHVRPTYSDGTVGFSGHPDDQAALQKLIAEEEAAQGDDVKDKDMCDGGMATVAAMRRKYAGGGKVRGALEALKLGRRRYTHKVGDRVLASKGLTGEDHDQVGTVTKVMGGEVEVKFSDAPGDKITVLHDEVHPTGPPPMNRR